MSSHCSNNEQKIEKMGGITIRIKVAILWQNVLIKLEK